MTVTASPSTLKKKGNVRLTVKVSPSVVGATVPLFKRVAGSARWTEVDVPGGSFTKGSSTYTVTVRGDARRRASSRSGAATPTTTATAARSRP